MNEELSMSHRIGPLKAVAFSLIIMLLFFSTAEIALRVWVYLFRSPAERFDIAAGTFVLVPGTHRSLMGEAIQINSHGFVGPEFEDPAPRGTVRIVTVGDSCTFGQGNYLGTYPGQLELRLNNIRGNRRYQVINAGIEGLDSGLALRRLVTKVIPLHPNIITVYIGWNDLMKFDPAGQVSHPGLAIVAHIMDQLWLIRGLRKVLFYYIRPYIFLPATGPKSRTGKFRHYRSAVFERNLKEIIASGRKAGAKIVLMTLPSVVSDDMDVTDLRQANVIFPYYVSAYAVGDYVDLIAAYNRSIRAIAAREGVAFVDLASELDRRPDRRQLFLDTMHPNQRGKELIAEILAYHLRASRLLTRGE